MRGKLLEVSEAASRLSQKDGIGIMNEATMLKSLVGQLDHLVLEFRRRM